MIMIGDKTSIVSLKQSLDLKKLLRLTTLQTRGKIECNLSFLNKQHEYWSMRKITSAQLKTQVNAILVLTIGQDLKLVYWSALKMTESLIFKELKARCSISNQADLYLNMVFNS